MPINHGTFAYAEHAEVLLFAWAIDNEPAQVCDMASGEELPAQLHDELHCCTTLVCAHQSAFDRTVLREALNIDIPIRRWRDTMVKALAHSLPGGLDKLSQILGLPVDKAKAKDGRQLIHLFTKPRPATSKIRRATRETHPAEWARFVDYARLDVEAMREADRKLPSWNYAADELALWHLDQEINDRGMQVDLDLAKAAIETVKHRQATLANRTQEITLGLVGSTTQRDELLRHLLEAYGVDLPDMQQSTIERRVKDPDLPKELRELLAIRLQSSTTSTAKYRTLMKGVSRDGRLRGTLQFNGASRTGRWCLAEGSPIRVRTAEGVVGEKPIETVLLSDQVWDGTEWVSHDGVVYSGDKEVITWDGVTATPEHQVWVSPTAKMPLAEAKERQLPLWQGAVVYRIYRLTSPSGRCYIGLTKGTLRERWRQHVKRAFALQENKPLYSAIRKYGPEAFTVEEIDSAFDIAAAQRLEVAHIAAHPQRYNISPGGEYDGAAGSAVFWSRMRADPEAFVVYTAKLSRLKRANDHSDYAALAAKALEWRVNNPREAYKLAMRGVRLARRKNRASAPLSKPAAERSLKERLLWKHKRGQMVAVNTTAHWQRRTDKPELAAKIAASMQKHWATFTPQERAAKTAAIRQSVDRSKQGPAASKGLKDYWIKLRTDPVRYAEYMARRNATLRQTIARKKAA